MPSHDLLLFFQDDVKLLQQWKVNGCHYSRTLEDWLRRQDARKAELWPLFVQASYPPKPPVQANPATTRSRRADVWCQGRGQVVGAVAPVLHGTWRACSCEDRLGAIHPDRALQACSELFRYNGGEEWGVSHYLFQRPE